MNCQLCQKEFVACHEGRLSDGIRIQVETHLRECQDCADQYHMMILAEKVMDEEKNLQSNPYLLTRIMAGIEELEQNNGRIEPITGYLRVLRPVLFTISVAAALFLGVILGDLYLQSQPASQLPVELTYMDDAALESVDLFSNL